MSRTLDLLADTTIHGTLDGYRTGCTGSCPGAVSCREVYVRYQGDWGFRKRVNAGETPAVLILAEREDADAVKARDRAANRAARRQDNRHASSEEHRKRRQKTGLGTKPLRKPRRKTTAEIHGDRIRALHAEGLSDRSIAQEIGIPEGTAMYVRSKIFGLPANIQPRRRKINIDLLRELNAQGLVDREIAVRMGVTTGGIQKAREAHGIPRNRDKPGPKPKAAA